MSIWVDADACPGPIKEILFRAAQRTNRLTVFVANRSLRVPRSPWIQSQLVEQGFDVADNYIVQQVQKGDLVVTADIPLAAEVIEKNALVVTPHGERFTADNIRPRLNMRDFIETMRASGEVTGGPPPFCNKDKLAFANELDKYLAKF
jgi:uncharacterized protein